MVNLIQNTPSQFARGCTESILHLDSIGLIHDNKREPDFIPPYKGWDPYCLKCSTMMRMRPTSFGWECRVCNNPIGRDLRHWYGPR